MTTRSWVWTPACGLHYKIFMIIIDDHNDSTIVIYDRNDSGLCYKTMIVASMSLNYTPNWSTIYEPTILIYDPKLRFKLKRNLQL